MRVVEHLALVCSLFAVASADSSCSASNETCETDETDEVAAVALSVSLQHGLSGLPSFPSFIEELGRTYVKGTKEYELRRKIYTQSLQNIQRHNRNPKRRWDAGVNLLSDHTAAEFAQLRGLRVVQAGASKASQSKALLESKDAVVLPDEKSWTHLNAITADSDQDACGSCWAVTTATTLWANAEAAGHSHTFSAQELVSCVPNPHSCGGTGGCQGSTVELALNWVMEQGLAETKDTPYEGKDTQCKKQASLLAHDGNKDDNEHLADMIAVGLHEAKSTSSGGLALGLRRWERLPENEYEPLLRAVAKTGPVAVSVGAREWHSYSRGVFDGCGVDSVIDHAVTLVGYGKDATSKDKYWLIKNSWGPSWGEKGFIRLFREEGNKHCGTDHQPEVGTACEHGPSTVPVCGMCGILYDAVVPHFDKKI